MKISERQRVVAQRARARMAGQPATLTFAEWEQTISDFNGLCAYCLKEPFTLLEHFVPVHLAGTHVRNCLTGCLGCNVRKRGALGNDLAKAIGQETVDRLQRYLEARTEKPDEPGRRRAYSPQAIFRPPRRAKDPYQWIEHVREDLGCNIVTLNKWIKQLGIEKYKFELSRYTYLARDDIKLLKEVIKSKLRKRAQ